MPPRAGRPAWWRSNRSRVVSSCCPCKQFRNQAASVIFAREIKTAANPEEERAKKLKEYADLYESPYPAAERGYVDDIIRPASTRQFIVKSLDALERKQVARLPRKYSNITL